MSRAFGGDFLIQLETSELGHPGEVLGRTHLYDVSALRHSGFEGVPAGSGQADSVVHCIMLEWSIVGVVW